MMHETKEEKEMMRIIEEMERNIPTEKVTGMNGQTIDARMSRGWEVYCKNDDSEETLDDCHSLDDAIALGKDWLQDADTVESYKGGPIFGQIRRTGLDDDGNEVTIPMVDISIPEPKRD